MMTAGLSLIFAATCFRILWNVPTASYGHAELQGVSPIDVIRCCLNFENNHLQGLHYNSGAYRFQVSSHLSDGKSFPFWAPQCYFASL